MVRAAVDESRIVVEKLSNRGFDPDFSRDDDSLLLNKCHFAFPPVLHCGTSETPGRGKKAATVFVPKGGSDPHLIWAAESRTSGVAPARFDFFPRPLSFLLRL